MFNKILVPTDGSHLSHKAIEAAIQFAQENHGEIVALSVAEPSMNAIEGSAFSARECQTYNELLQKVAHGRVEEVARRARAKNISCRTTVTLSVNPYEEIVDATKRFECDVIFMGTHARQGLNMLLLGSQTQKVLSHSNIPVVVFR